MSFRRAVTKTPVRMTATTNGMATHSSSGNPLLDFFATSGAMRQWSEGRIVNAFNAAFNHDPLNALRALFYARDARNGQGERRLFRVILKDLAERYPNVVAANLPLVSKYGRWDDLMATEGTEMEPAAAALWINAIGEGNRLAAKWAPRKGHWFGLMQRLADTTPRGWRKTLVAHTDVVESRMCRKMFDTIDYKSVPSRAAMIYRRAFAKRDHARYDAFIKAALKGDVKINASVLYPHEFASRFQRGPDATLEAQWKNLPDWITSGRGFLPMCDVSGSMSGQPMDVSIGLGVYLAEKNKSAFKDLVVTFSESPTFVDLSNHHTVRGKMLEVRSAPWGMNTDLTKAFQIMLELATREKVAPEDMPQSVLIISDMQFDGCVTRTGMQTIERLYRLAGYTVPQVVFWNVNAHAGQSPVTEHKSGAALVSGFSPSIMKSILSRSPQATPVEVMMETLEKYDDVRVG